MTSTKLPDTEGLMTIAQAKNRVGEIAACTGDDEVAHAEEDRFRHDVLVAIVNGAENPRVLAGIALSTSNLQFARWCA